MDVQDTNGYDIYKIFEDLFLSTDEGEEKILEGIQSEDLCKIRSGVSNKKVSGVDAEIRVESIYKNKYRINLDHRILTDHGAFYPPPLSAPCFILRPKFDVSSPNAVHQADLLFLPHDKLPHGRKVYKYALTVVDVASCYKAAEPLTSKESDEVLKAF